MASSVRLMMMERGLDANSTGAPAQFNATGQQNATFALINNLVFAQSKSVRTSTIILASFNVLAAFATASSILYDCYWASKRCNPKFKASKFCISSIHPAETFPLILAIGIVVQGLVFAAVQGQGMQDLFTDGCDVIAQFMFPALFIVPFIQVVFGLECALRSLRKIPFQARGKYDVTICGVVVLLMVIGTWVPSFIFKQPAKCFASLVWFISRYGALGLLILATVAGLMVISALTIFTRLSTVTMVDQHQRIAASRMVYYLVLGIMSLALVIPYFVSQMNGKKGCDLKLAMMATVVVNLSGLMNGLLQLFLRSNTSTTSFGPKHSRNWNRGKHEIRMWGPNELVFGNHLVDPVSGPRTPQTPPADKNRSESRTSLIGFEKISMDSMRSPPFRSPGSMPPTYPSTAQMTTMPTIPEPVKGFPQRSSSRHHSRKQSYSLFPVEAAKSPSRPNDSAESVYDITGLAPPPMIQFGTKGHKRDSSIASSATVQIGLRLSHAPEATQDLEPLPLPSTTYNPNNPPLSYSNAAQLPMTAYNPTPQPKSPSPLQVLTTFDNTSPRPELALRSPPRAMPTPINTAAISRSPEHSPVRGSTPCINKDLPPTPRAELAPLVEALRVSNTQLTPAVYSPSNGKEKQVINGLPTSGPKCPKGSESPPNSNEPTNMPGEQLRKDWI